MSLNEPEEAAFAEVILADAHDQAPVQAVPGGFVRCNEIVRSDQIRNWMDGVTAKLAGQLLNVDLRGIGTIKARRTSEHGGLEEKSESSEYVGQARPRRRGAAHGRWLLASPRSLAVTTDRR